MPWLVRPPGKLYRGAYYTLPRVAIIQFLETWRGKIKGKVLDVGVGSWELPRQLLGPVCHYTATDCFDHPNVDVVSDIHNLTEVFAAESFDFVICTDVLEHVASPWIAVKELYAVLKPGGTLLLTTPFNFHLHATPATLDYWRFTADGLRQLLDGEAGFEHVEIQPTGHREFPYSYTVVARKPV